MIEISTKVSLISWYVSEKNESGDGLSVII